MPMSIRRLGPGDEAILSRLAALSGDFDIAGRSEPEQPLGPEAAARYLANPAVLHWVAFAGVEPFADPVGDLYCLHLPLGSGEGSELLLYDLGVHWQWRRRGIGRQLIAHMHAWMRANQVNEVWVCADNPEAVAFYRACGFGVETGQPVYMTRSLEPDGA